MYIVRRPGKIYTEEQLNERLSKLCINYSDQSLEQSQTSNNGNFLKSMIKINNPTWTQEQIEAEFKKQMERNNEGDDNGCEACSG